MTVRVLVVDDSVTMRNLISSVLRRDPDIDVVGCASDPLEAREAIKKLAPDVITLDVEMPNMNGLQFLERIMRLRPMPVVMVSTLTHAGADASLAALEAGAVDCVGKPNGAMPETFSELADRVKAAASARVRHIEGRREAPASGRYEGNGKIIAIGSSTGGVEALLTILSRFPANCPPTLITQHMPATFTKSFAARLDRLCAPSVSEAHDGAPLAPGRIYIAPGGEAHLRIAGVRSPRCSLREGAPVNGHRPSVDVLFESVAETVGAGAVGVILTGMGRDGASGLLAMRSRGAHTIGQDEESAIVYGMPKVASQIGAVVQQLPLGRIADAALEACSAVKQRSA